MEAKEIIQNLKSTPYKFTYASRVKDELKKMDDEDCNELILELRRQISNPDNREIVKPLRQILI